MSVTRTGDTITASYKHHFANTATLYLGVSTGGDIVWQAAYRDMDGSRPVVFADFPELAGAATVWVRDDQGERKVGTVR